MPHASLSQAILPVQLSLGLAANHSSNATPSIGDQMLPSLPAAPSTLLGLITVELLPTMGMPVMWLVATQGHHLLVALCFASWW